MTVLGRKRQVEALINFLKQRIDLRCEGMTMKVGDEVSMLAKKIRRTDRGYVMYGGEKLIEQLVAQFHLETARRVDTPGVKQEPKERDEQGLSSDGARA